MSEFDDGKFVGSWTVAIKGSALLLVWGVTLGWNDFIWSERGNEFLTPFILNNELNMGSTFNMISSLDFLNYIRIYNTVLTVGAAGVLTKQILKG